jgi:hypothetical protein
LNHYSVKTFHQFSPPKHHYRSRLKFKINLSIICHGIQYTSNALPFASVQTLQSRLKRDEPPCRPLLLQLRRLLLPGPLLAGHGGCRFFILFRCLSCRYVTKPYYDDKFGRIVLVLRHAAPRANEPACSARHMQCSANKQ